MANKRSNAPVENHADASPNLGQPLSVWLGVENNFEELAKQIESAEEFASELTGNFKVEVCEPPRSVFGR